MARVHRRIKTGRLVARALDNTFTGTTHVVALITPDGFPREGTLPNRSIGNGGVYTLAFASLDGPNGFSGNNGSIHW